MALIWGIPYLFIKIAVGELTPATLVFLRSLIGASILLPVALARKDLAPLRRYWKWILAYTFVEVAAPWFLLSDAERRISSSLTGLLIAAVPSIGAVLAVVTGGHDRLDSRRTVGLILGFVGVAALVGLDVRADDLGGRAGSGGRAAAGAIHCGDRDRLWADRSRFGARDASRVNSVHAGLSGRGARSAHPIARVTRVLGARALNRALLERQLLLRR